ncbi:serine/threonine-protein kinase [Actinomadura fibrosa]|uniref:Serine/threonine-protein kinase n=1 Tax=Actinomadura fibrosa TaxID=111802 RepID=A0ABW2XC85_9ACTN|nr:serine/threonine-protein kinase [Actinomadura fibrosa]
MPALPLEHDDPRTIGRYRLTGRLGEGGQGVVYLGEGPSGERVAVKVLKTTDAAARARFAREMRAARQVAAFCTAAVLDSSAEGEVPYVVSEFIDGPSLQQRVAERGPLRGGELHRLAVNTASALAAVHGAGIVHRDLKPANVLLGPDGPRVVDFGIARAIDAETHTQLVGTPAYFAPEWLEGHPPTDRSDVFAWAGTMVYAATGHPPFGPPTSVPATLHRIANGAPDLNGVPPALRPLLAECLAKDPSHRPTARDLMVRLVDPSATTGPPAPTHPHPAPGTPPYAATTVTGSPSRRPRNLALAAAVAAAAVIALAATTYVLLSGQKDDKRDPETTKTSRTSEAAKSSTPTQASTTNAGNGTVPADFAGTWKGTLKQTGGLTLGDSTTTVTIRLTAGSAKGTADYETWDCHNTLTVSASTPTRVDFQETVNQTNGSTGFCQGGTVTLERASGSLKYTSPGVGTTTGTVSRAG